jgi:hypothetical protein
LLSRENIHQLRPDIPAERFRLHRGKNCRYAEFLGSLGQHDHVVDELLTLDVGYPEDHLGLMVDEDHSRVFGGDEPSIGIRKYVCHDCSFQMFRQISLIIVLSIRACGRCPDCCLPVLEFTQRLPCA